MPGVGESSSAGLVIAVSTLLGGVLLAIFAFPASALYLLPVAIAILLFALVRWPSSPILVIYPITWVLGAYPVELVGGRVERIIAILGLVGALLTANRTSNKVPLLPATIKLGIVIMFAAYLLSWMQYPDLPEAGETMISLLSRIVFLSLVVFHIKSEKDLKLMITIFIASTFIACLATFWIGIEYGFGYIRDYELSKTVKQNVDPLIETISRNMNQATAAGVLLIGLFPYVKRGKLKLLLVAAVLFIFWMAFAAEFRREILITIPVVLGYLYLDKRSGLSKIALPLLVLSAILFFLVLLPESPILRERLEKETPDVFERRESRMVSFAAGAAAFATSPLLGYGPGSYESIVFPRLPYDASPVARKPYNVFLWIAVEGGVFGLVGMLMLMGGVYVIGRRLHATGNMFTDVVVRLAPLFVVLITIWFVFGSSWDASIPWFLMGLILAVRRIIEGSNPKVVR